MARIMITSVIVLVQRTYRRIGMFRGSFNFAIREFL